MINEQEAIEYLKQFSKLMKKWDATEISSNIDTVLSLIKENQTEIEKYKTLYDRALSDVVKADKQIDLMAISILVKKIGDYPCGYKQDCIKSDKEYRDIHCKDCIKQYFETKAKKGE